MLGQDLSSLPKIREEPADDVSMQELAFSLRQHLGTFSEKLEVTRERLEDTAKCYHLMDKTYEWALEAMRFVSRMGISSTQSAEGLVLQIRSLQEYLEDHPSITEEVFTEMTELATRLGNEKLVEQCKIAKIRCQETVDLIETRQATLLKAKQQTEVDSLRGPLWENEGTTPTSRTTRSLSQPTNMWTPPGASTPFPLTGLGHHRRRSASNALTPTPQQYGSPSGSYTSFPSSYYSTAKDTYHLDSFMQEKEEQLLQHGLITEDLTAQGPVASISRSVLDSRVSHREGISSSSSSASSSSSNSSKCAVNILRRSGRGGCSGVAANSANRWSKRHTRRSQTWQLRDEALEKMKAEVKEQNAMLRVERLNTAQDGSSDSIHSFETELSPSTESCCKVPVSHTRSDPVRSPVPVNTHLLSPTSSEHDTTDSSVSNEDAANDAAAKAKKTLMLIMKEMIQTERDYVKSLEYIIENYIPELLREDIPQALRGQRNVVFGNIEKIYEFHSQYFLQELEQCENIPFSVGQCFLNYEPQFYLYALYNKNKPKSDTLMTEYGNTFFRKKQLELGDKMDLASYLLKPVQRMGKYALLLKQLLKECPEREAEYQDLTAAEEMVRFQLRHGNDLLAMDTLRDCDVNVKEQGRLLRQDEFLVWQGRSRKSLRHVFLFEDLILFSKARRDLERKGHEVYQYKHSIKTTDIGLTEQVGDSPTKFEIWFRKRKLNDTYVLQAPNAEIKRAWVMELSNLLWKQALRSREMRMAEMSSMGIGNKPCLDIKPSEDQINDRSISIHQLARAPRFRNSVAVSPYDLRTNRRPHSVISVSSSSSSGSSQSSFTFYGTLNLGFEPGDSPRPLHRSLTQQSQCSTESGFCTDASTAGDSPVDSEQPHHKKATRSDSLLSSDSFTTSITTSELCSPCEDQTVEESITTSM